MPNHTRRNRRRTAARKAGQEAEGRKQIVDMMRRLRTGPNSAERLWGTMMRMIGPRYRTKPGIYTSMGYLR